MKILIAVDDSAYTQKAMEWVERMSWPKASEFIVVSAVSQPVATAYAFAGGPAPAMAAVGYDVGFGAELEHHRKLASGLQERLRGRGLETTVEVRPGDPREVIADVARERDVDLVVMGSRGRTGFPKLLLGSVASHVIGHAPCSVLVVKGAPQPAPGSVRP